MLAFWNNQNLKPSVARKQTVKHTHFVCLTASFLATGGFVKLFHKIPWFFHDYSGFIKFHDFSMHGTVLVIFQVFHDFQSLWEPWRNNCQMGKKIIMIFHSNHFLSIKHLYLALVVVKTKIAKIWDHKIQFKIQLHKKQ